MSKKSAEKRSKPGTIKFTTRPSALPGTEGKHYGVVVPNGTVDLDGLIDNMIKHGGARLGAFGHAELKFIIDEILQTAAQEIEKKLCAVDLGFCRLVPVIKGRFDSEDAPFDRKRHKVEIAAIPSQEIKRAAGGLIGVNVTPVDVPPPRIDSVCQAPDYVRNAISAAEPFEIHGTGLTTGQGGETAELDLSTGVRVPVTLRRQTKADGARRVRAQLAESLPTPCPRRARLIFRTHGLGGANSPLMEIRSASVRLI